MSNIGEKFSWISSGFPVSPCTALRLASAFPLIFHRCRQAARQRRPSCFRARVCRKRPDVPRQSAVAEKSQDYEAWINREGIVSAITLHSHEIRLFMSTFQWNRMLQRIGRRRNMRQMSLYSLFIKNSVTFTFYLLQTKKEKIIIVQTIQNSWLTKFFKICHNPYGNAIIYSSQMQWLLCTCEENIKIIKIR